MLSAAQIWPSVSRYLEIFFGLRGPSPRLLPASGGWVHRPAPEASLIRGMPTAPRAFLEMPDACGLRPCARSHPKKGLVPHLPVGWGEQQIPQINIGLNLSSCRVALRPAVLSAARIWPSVSRYLEISFGLRGPSPRLLPASGGWVNRPAPEASLIRGMPTGPLVFWKCRTRVGYGPALGPTIKKALCHTCSLGGVVIKYRRSLSVLSELYETSYLFYVTLSFLCNIICFLISVLVFSLVTLFGATTVR